MWICSVGVAIARAAAAMPAESAGRRSTGFSTLPQIRPSRPGGEIGRAAGSGPSRRRRRLQRRRREGPASEPTKRRRRPSSSPIPMEMNVLSPENSIPAIADGGTETGTERPDVAAAASSAARSLRPAAATALAAQVEQRVVDAHGEAHRRTSAAVRVHRRDVADDVGQADGGNDGHQAEHQRDPGGKERPEHQH